MLLSYADARAHTLMRQALRLCLFTRFSITVADTARPLQEQSEDAVASVIMDCFALYAAQS